MLSLFQSNQMGVLAEVFCARAPEGRDPFEPLTVIVQSLGMGQWLKMQLAEHHGIAAQVDAVLPANFLWGLYQKLVPGARDLRESPFDREQLAFRIMRLLKGAELSPAVSSYLAGEGDGDLLRYQLSEQLAGLFDQYLLYRPQWMQDWREPVTKGSAVSEQERWQRKLWRLLVADLPEAERHLDRASLHLQAMAAFRAGEVGPAQLPGRLAVFGLSTMPPLQLEALQAIGGVTDVDIYFLNPCQHYWGDIVSPKDMAKRSVRALLQGAGQGQPLTDDDYLEIGNPILSSFGKQGREFLEMLLELDSLHTVEHFAPDEADGALARVKQEIFNLEFGEEFGSGLTPSPQPLPDNRSIQLHSCHSRLREVEVLRDQLLHILASDRSISLSDIIVMVPNVSDYAPLVQTVFGDPLHYRISDRSQPEEAPLLASFLQLLALPHSRFTAAEVLDLLESPAIARQFDLDEEELAQLAIWVSELAIRWEVDGEAKVSHWQLPAADNNTWRFGLDRLLLGFARAATEGVWEGVLAHDISPQETELVGKLAHIIDLLAEYRDQFTQPRTISDWQLLLDKLLGQFFHPVQEEVLEVTAIREALQALVNAASEAGQEEQISFGLISYLLTTQLGSKTSGAGFMSGGITFATLVPMRSIPFKVVCLLGMNDGEYPRDKRPLSFDLLQEEHRKGDRSRKLDDRYLFLEALLSAQDIFYVSYIGLGIRDNEPKPPSVLVTEWQAYLQAIFTGFEPMEHPLQPFSAKHYAGDAYQSYSQVWHTDEVGSEPEAPFVKKALAADEELRLTSAAQLGQFLSHSGRFFLQQRLGVYFDQDELAPSDTEPFALDQLERYQLADSALTALLNKRDMDNWRATQIASGLVMPGDLGEEQLEPQISLAEGIANKVDEYRRGELREVSGEWSDGQDSLFYRLENIYGDLLLSYRAGGINARYLLAAYLRHLLGGVKGEALRTVCIGKKDKRDVEVISLRPLDADECHSRLCELTQLFRQGTRQPLLLAPALCRTYAEQLAKSDDGVMALSRARTSWEADLPGAEQHDPYWARLFEVPRDLDKTFTTNASNIWLPLLGAQEDAG